jgi:hypothetical protein
MQAIKKSAPIVAGRDMEDDTISEHTLTVELDSGEAFKLASAADEEQSAAGGSTTAISSGQPDADNQSQNDTVEVDWRRQAIYKPRNHNAANKMHSETDLIT